MKIAIVMFYLYSLGGVLLWTGEKVALIALIIPHIVQTILVNSPSAQRNLGQYNTQQ